jgi:hypothetical protein
LTRNGTQKLLIGTYVDEGQYDLALAEMQKLDSTTLDNAEFIALCTAIMDSTLNTTPTEGGRLANVLQQTQHIANNTNSGNKIFAQSALALYKMPIMCDIVSQLCLKHMMP